MSLLLAAVLAMATPVPTPPPAPPAYVPDGTYGDASSYCQKTLLTTSTSTQKCASAYYTANLYNWPMGWMAGYAAAPEPTPAPTVTVTATPEPGPTVTVTSTPEAVLADGAVVSLAPVQFGALVTVGAVLVIAAGLGIGRKL